MDWRELDLEGKCQGTRGGITCKINFKRSTGTALIPHSRFPRSLQSRQSASGLLSQIFGSCSAVRQQGTLAFSLHCSFHLEPSSHFFSLQSVKKTQEAMLFSPHNQTDGDPSVFLTGNSCKNQTLFLLRSAGEGKKKKTLNEGEKKITRPHPWEQEKI